MLRQITAVVRTEPRDFRHGATKQQSPSRPHPSGQALGGQSESSTVTTTKTTTLTTSTATATPRRAETNYAAPVPACVVETAPAASHGGYFGTRHRSGAETQGRYTYASHGSPSRTATTAQGNGGDWTSNTSMSISAATGSSLTSLTPYTGVTQCATISSLALHRQRGFSQSQAKSELRPP